MAPDLEAMVTSEIFTECLNVAALAGEPKDGAFEGAAIPDVLLCGDHAKIAAWRRAEAERITRERRPDLLETKPR